MLYYILKRNKATLTWLAAMLEKDMLRYRNEVLGYYDVGCFARWPSGYLEHT